jgi:hypothetical protein
MKVIEDACFTYACVCTVKTTTKPAQPIEKSTAGRELVGAGDLGQIRGSPPSTSAGQNVCAAWRGAAGPDLVCMGCAVRATDGAAL